MNSISTSDLFFDALYSKCQHKYQHLCLFKQHQLLEQSTLFKERFAEFFNLIETYVNWRMNNQAYAKDSSVHVLKKLYCTIFLETVLNRIHVYDIQTLCDGLTTHIADFMDEYTYWDQIYTDCYYYEEMSNPDEQKILPDFGNILDTYNGYNYYRRIHLSVIEKGHRETADHKDIKKDMYLKRVQGHRRDYERHVYNKGQNKKQRNHGFRLKDRKNKKQLDYRV